MTACRARIRTAHVFPPRSEPYWRAWDDNTPDDATRMALGWDEDSAIEALRERLRGLAKAKKSKGKQ